MSEEERKEEQVAPEVLAAHQMLMRAIDDLQVAADEEQHRGGVPSKIRAVGRWADICGHDIEAAVVDAFRHQVAVDVGSLWSYVRNSIEGGEPLVAVRYLRKALETLIEYTKLLRLEIPPEEEEVPPARGGFEAPSAAEEVKLEVIVEEPPEGAPLAGLGLSKRVYNLLVWHFYPVLGREPLVEDIVDVLEDEAKGEEYLLNRVKFFGPVALAELKEKLVGKGFLPAEEEPNTDWEAYDEAVY